MQRDERFESPEQFLERLRTTSTRKGVAGRAVVARLAKGNSSQALAVARAIEHPWYRCQAIASVVELNTAHPHAEALLLEALDAAYSQVEPNRVASVALWPLRLLVNRDAATAPDHVERLLRIISQEPHGLRRLDGLRAILVAVAPSAQMRKEVLERFCVAAEASRGWRTERIVDVAANVLAPYDRAAALALLVSRPATRFTRRTRELLSQSPEHGRAGT